MPVRDRNDRLVLTDPRNATFITKNYYTPEPEQNRRAPSSTASELRSIGPGCASSDYLSDGDPAEQARSLQSPTNPDNPFSREYRGSLQKYTDSSGQSQYAEYPVDLRRRFVRPGGEQTQRYAPYQADVYRRAFPESASQPQPFPKYQYGQSQSGNMQFGSFRDSQGRPNPFGDPAGASGQRRPVANLYYSPRRRPRPALPAEQSRGAYVEGPESDFSCGQPRRKKSRRESRNSGSRS